MVFAFSEDGTLEVLDSRDLAEQFEPFDVENRVFVFYDEDGTWLQPNFTQPNRRGFLGMTLSQGKFELVRSAQSDPTIDSFEVALQEAVSLEPNRHFKSVDEISSYVASKKTSRL